MKISKKNEVFFCSGMCLGNALLIFFVSVGGAALCRQGFAELKGCVLGLRFEDTAEIRETAESAEIADLADRQCSFGQQPAGGDHPGFQQILHHGEARHFFELAAEMVFADVA